MTRAILKRCGLVERNREWLDRIERIAHFDYYRNAMAGNWLAPMPLPTTGNGIETGPVPGHRPGEMND